MDLARKAYFFCSLSVFFKVSKNKKDPENNFKVKQFIAWWIDKSFSKWPDKPIVVLFDMTDVGLSNVVRYFLMRNKSLKVNKN